MLSHSRRLTKTHDFKDSMQELNREFRTWKRSGGCEVKWKRSEDCFMVRHFLLLAVVCEVKQSESATFKHIRTAHGN